MLCPLYSLIWLECADYFVYGHGMSHSSIPRNEDKPLSPPVMLCQRLLAKCSASAPFLKHNRVLWRRHHPLHLPKVKCLEWSTWNFRDIAASRAASLGAIQYGNAAVGPAQSERQCTLCTLLKKEAHFKCKLSCIHSLGSSSCCSAFSYLGLDILQQ